ncbi:MAG: septal ring lytic transglycosylase RlpA family protein [Gaiellaceae bacterium]
MRLVAQRLGLLAAIALVALLVTFELAHKLSGRSSSSASPIQAVPAPGSNWKVVRAGILELSEKGKQTACGVTIGPKTYGVAHPSLPCGARIFIAYGHTQVLTEVLERGPYVPGRGLDLTPALAARLGIDAVTDVRWRFAR